jgi:hypothetical protein
MSTLTEYLETQEAYDYIWLAGMKSPGVVTLSGHDRTLGWDVKKAPGQKGATTTLTGDEPAEFTASFYLVRDDSVGRDDFADWPAFDAMIRSSVDGKEPKALDVYNPDLATNGITSVVLKKFGGVKHDGKGGQTIDVVFLEYRPAKPAGGTPKGSQTKKKNPDPDQAALDELKKLTDEYQKTPWQ